MFSLPYDFLNIFFSLIYCIVRMQYIIYKICINQWFVIS